ncbi:hypothetical protein [Mesorhizobium marinum]|uniref:hypothetical protein n=1 Tax=Mesorhizobium marinum TaxID=3228790 RepID=UPI0034678EEA
MKYIETSAFNQWAKRAQREMLTGIFDSVRPRIIDWNQSVSLPIYSGSKRWTRFRVVLKAYTVMAQYEAPFADEDPQFVGAGVKNEKAIGFAAPGADTNVDLGDTYDIGLEVFSIDYLNLLPYSAELVVRAYDQAEPIAKTIISEFADTASSSLKGATATIPFGSQASGIGLAVIDKIARLASGPKQIGSHYYMFSVRKRLWNRPSTQTYWSRFKFVAFVEEDPDDKDTPYKEIYLTLWELILESDEAITGQETGVESRGELKSDTRTEAEKAAGAEELRQRARAEGLEDDGGDDDAEAAGDREESGRPDAEAAGHGEAKKVRKR